MKEEDAEFDHYYLEKYLYTMEDAFTPRVKTDLKIGVLG